MPGSCCWRANAASLFSFGMVPVNVNWVLATWTELVGTVSLLVLDGVAWVSVDTGNEHNACGNGYRLPSALRGPFEGLEQREIKNQQPHDLSGFFTYSRHSVRAVFVMLCIY